MDENRKYFRLDKQSYYFRINFLFCSYTNIYNYEQDKIEKNKLFKKNKAQNHLWFVNIGGYKPTSMQEKHEFGLVTASTKLEAKNIAKSRWLVGYKKKHKDDISSLEMLISCDDCEPIKKIGNWKIELTPENKFIEENNYPDWCGYRRIDKI